MGNGTFVRHLTNGVVGPYDVEECGCGWLVACGGSDSVDFVRSGANGEDGAGGVVADASCIGGDGDAGGSGVTDSCGGSAGGGAGSGGCGGEPLERGGVRAAVLPTTRLGKRGRGHGEFHDPTALAWVPGIGGFLQNLAQDAAVFGKILVLAGIILFLQWRPAGLFAPRSRSLDE